MLQHGGERRRGRRGKRVGGGAGDGDALAWARQVDGGETEKQREGGDDFKIDDGLETDAAHLFEVARAGDAVDQGGEDQRRNDGADEAQENVADGFQVRGKARRGGAHGHAGGHANEDPGSQRKAFHRSPHLSFWRSTSKNICRGGRTANFSTTSMRARRPAESAVRARPASVSCC